MFDRFVQFRRVFFSWVFVVFLLRVANEKLNHETHETLPAAAPWVSSSKHLIITETQRAHRYAAGYKVALLALGMLLIVTPNSYAAKIKTADDLITAMHKKYENKWYRTTTFRQVTTDYDKDGNKKEAVWYEAITIPGKLRIDFDPVKSGNGILFANDNIYTFKDGKLESSRPLIHPLVLLAFDVYFLPVEQTLTKLKQLKFDLSVLREDTWQGRPVYVVGAKAGDNHSPQFWIDKQQLYFVRMLRPAGKGGTQTSEVQFNKYQRLGGGWMAPEVVFMIDGKITTTESYSELRADVPLSNDLFEPTSWSSAKHWRQ